MDNQLCCNNDIVQQDCNKFLKLFWSRNEERVPTFKNIFNTTKFYLLI